jgi:hypothetical protein
VVESPLAIQAERRDTDENWGTPNDTWRHVDPSLAHDCESAGTVISPATPRGSPSIEKVVADWV